MVKGYVLGSGEPIETNKAFFYGSLYMDVGESWQKVESQLQVVRDFTGDFTGGQFDVICLKSQEKKALLLSKRVRKEMLSILPKESVRVNVLFAKYKGHDPRRN